MVLKLMLRLKEGRPGIVTDGADGAEEERDVRLDAAVAEELKEQSESV